MKSSPSAAGLLRLPVLQIPFLAAASQGFLADLPRSAHFETVPIIFSMPQRTFSCFEVLGISFFWITFCAWPGSTYMESRNVIDMYYYT